MSIGVFTLCTMLKNERNISLGSLRKLLSDAAAHEKYGLQLQNSFGEVCMVKGKYFFF